MIAELEYVTKLKGTAGGLTAQTSASRTTMSAKTTPTRKTSPLRSGTNEAWSRAANAWKNEVSSAEKALWKQYGQDFPTTDSCGVARTLSARAAFMRSNTRLIKWKLPPITSPPGNFTATAPGTITLVYTPAPNQKLTVTPATPPDGTELVIIRARTPCSPGESTAKKRLYTLTTITAATPSPWDITAAYLARYLVIPAGRQIQADCYYLDTTSTAESTRTPLASVLT